MNLVFISVCSCLLWIGFGSLQSLSLEKSILPNPDVVFGTCTNCSSHLNASSSCSFPENKVRLYVSEEGDLHEVCVQSECSRVGDPNATESSICDTVIDISTAELDAL